MVNKWSILQQSLHTTLAFECYLCGEVCTAGGLLCDCCWKDIMVEHGSFSCLKNDYSALDYTFALSPYCFPLDKLLFALKYQGQLILARELGRRLAEKIIESRIEKPDYLIPVPLHSLRLLARGFNQAKEIASTVSANLSIPLLSMSTKRIRSTRPQFALSAKQRKRNIKGAFRVKNKELSGSFVIIDDIVTTGTTANELAARLKEAGADKVGLWACARAD